MAYPTTGKTGITEFLELSLKYPVIDVRSPGEFAAGHIPEAVNIPLFDDREREMVGITYRKEGRIQAILRGLEAAGPSLSSKLRHALEISGDGKLLVYCWRGGMRSEAMAWLFSTGDIETEVLLGGYKSYRQHILESFSERKKVMVLGGLTGSGKTDILNYLSESGHRVIDLERLANHRGSAFGALGQPEQPTTEHFANLLFREWKKISNEDLVWIEDESRNIGSVFMPENFYLNLQQSPVVILMMDPDKRIPRLLREYSAISPDDLKASVIKISRRIGGEKTKEIMNAIEKGDLARAIEIILDYYDRAYRYGIRKKVQEKVTYVYTDTDDVRTNAGKILEAAKEVTFI
ncbi:MAG: tRNA 2-selenouridine(34) synthase MnmH [Bacteroidales bacterium]|nr:tRNA 2-selenouridine(34) synthase MnmH [Bacteroidales bacterium]